MLGKLIFLVWVLSVPVLGAAQIKPEGLPDSEVLPAEPNPHWVWVNEHGLHAPPVCASAEQRKEGV